MILILLLLAFVTLFYAYVKWKQTYWKRLGLPSLDPTFLIGNMWTITSFKEHVGLLYHRWYNDHPNLPYVGYYNYLKPALLIRDPDIIKDIIITDYNHFQAMEMVINEKLDPLLGANPFVLTGDKWKSKRQALTQVITPTKIKAIYPMIASNSEQFVKYIKTFSPTKDVEAKELGQRFAIQNVVSCEFSIDAKCLDPDHKSEFFEIGEKIFAPSLSLAIKMMSSAILPQCISDLVPIPILSTEADRWFRNIIKENKKSRNGVNVNNNDIMQSFLTLQEKNNVSDEDLTAYSLNFFIEGFETSSTAMSFILYELARNEECQDRAHQEIIEVLQHHDNKISFDALNEMTYLECAVFESLRMHPVGAFSNRVCTKSYKLPSLPNQKELVILSEGTLVSIPIRALHHDPNYYPDPEVFDPNRFMEEERKKRHRAVYLGFGEGPRMCIGQRFAMTQIKAALAYTLKDLKVTVSPNHKPIVPDAYTPLWQAKDGVLVNFSKRND